MIGTIVLAMLLGWLAYTAFMAILSSGPSQHLDTTSDPRTQHVSAGPPPTNTPSQDTGER